MASSRNKWTREAKIAAVSLAVAVVAVIVAISIPEIRCKVGLETCSSEELYTGRILDQEQQVPISGAKVILFTQATPVTLYTDAEGVYQFSINSKRIVLTGVVRVEARGYGSYERRVDVSRKQVEDIRLNKIRSSAEPSPTVSIPAALPTSSIPVTLPTSAPIIIEKGETITEVIRFFPQIPKNSKKGYCGSNSDILKRSDAWRCISGSYLYDPCFKPVTVFGSSSENIVICDARPGDSSSGFRLNLTKPLPQPEIYPTLIDAWILELFDGTTCSFVKGATSVIDEKRVNYLCGSNMDNLKIVIIGEPIPGKIWAAESVHMTSSRTIEKIETVKIRKVWK